MTNGEKLKEIFPNIIKYGNILIDDTGALQKNILFDDTWWNAEYKEPTTKNETLISLDVYKQVVKERDIAIEQLHELGYDFGQKIEPRKGHWDKDGACPFCGYFQQWKDDAFCGHCGAQLGEVKK